MSDVGIESPFWFMGIVEDAEDPTNQGRVKVRVFGMHPSWEAGIISTADLPWAVPINGSYGGTAQTPRVTDWVFGFFSDGRDAQHPFILGTIPGQNLMSMSGSGSENSSAYTRPSEEARRFYGKPPLHPAQSGENLHDTQLVIQEGTRKEEVPIANDGAAELYKERTGWSEPSSAISSDSSRTTIFSSPYGDSYIEINGQEDNEFINISHASGSQVQIDGNGDIKIKSLGDSFSVVEGNQREYTGGRRDIKIDGKYTIKVENGDCTLEVDGNLNHVVHGDYNLNVGGRFAASVGTSIEMAAGRMSLETTAEHFNLFSKKEIKLQSQEGLSINSDKIIQMKTPEPLFMDAMEIWMNSDKAQPAIAYLTQIDLPRTMGIAIDGNQAHMKATNLLKTSIGGLGNLNGGTTLDDYDDPNLNPVDTLPDKIELEDGINRETPTVEPVAGGSLVVGTGGGFGGEFGGGGSGGGGGGGAPSTENAQAYLNSPKAFYHHWNSFAFRGDAVAVIFHRGQPVIAVSINGVKMSRHGTDDNGRVNWRTPRNSRVLSGTLKYTYSNGTTRSIKVTEKGSRGTISYGPSLT